MLDQSNGSSRDWEYLQYRNLHQRICIIETTSPIRSNNKCSCKKRNKKLLSGTKRVWYKKSLYRSRSYYINPYFVTVGRSDFLFGFLRCLRRRNLVGGFEYYPKGILHGRLQFLGIYEAFFSSEGNPQLSHITKCGYSKTLHG